MRIQRGAHDCPGQSSPGTVIRPGQTIADIGAGTGYFTLPMSHLAGSRRFRSRLHVPRRALRAETPLPVAPSTGREGRVPPERQQRFSAVAEDSRHRSDPGTDHPGRGRRSAPLSPVLRINSVTGTPTSACFNTPTNLLYGKLPLYRAKSLHSSQAGSCKILTVHLVYFWPNPSDMLLLLARRLRHRIPRQLGITRISALPGDGEHRPHPRQVTTDQWRLRTLPPAPYTKSSTAWSFAKSFTPHWKSCNRTGIAGCASLAGNASSPASTASARRRCKCSSIHCIWSSHLTHDKMSDCLTVADSPDARWSAAFHAAQPWHCQTKSWLEGFIALQ